MREAAEDHRASLLDMSGYTTLSSSLQSRASVLLLEDAFPSCEDISFPPPFQVHSESQKSILNDF
jgi:hypothetical protein